LALRSRLSDIQQLTPWIENLSRRYRMSEKLHFAVDLCLEEALSNIVQYGYCGTETGSILVSFQVALGKFEFIVDDTAPQFNPLEAPELPPLNPHEEMRLGGQGIRLLRRFADEIHYERTPMGNRLIIRFLITATDAGITNTV